MPVGPPGLCGACSPRRPCPCPRPESAAGCTLQGRACWAPRTSTRRSPFPVHTEFCRSGFVSAAPRWVVSRAQRNGNKSQDLLPAVP